MHTCARTGNGLIAWQMGLTCGRRLDPILHQIPQQRHTGKSMLWVAVLLHQNVAGLI